MFSLIICILLLRTIQSICSSSMWRNFLKLLQMQLTTLKRIMEGSNTDLDSLSLASVITELTMSHRVWMLRLSTWKHFIFMSGKTGIALGSPPLVPSRCLKPCRPSGYLKSPLAWTALSSSGAETMLELMGMTVRWAGGGGSEIYWRGEERHGRWDNGNDGGGAPYPRRHEDILVPIRKYITWLWASCRAGIEIANLWELKNRSGKFPTRPIEIEIEIKFIQL
jgi:hypothetical protein